jgi:hypothetical protein
MTDPVHCCIPSGQRGISLRFVQTQTAPLPPPQGNNFLNGVNVLHPISLYREETYALRECILFFRATPEGSPV